MLASTAAGCASQRPLAEHYEHREPVLPPPLAGPSDPRIAAPATDVQAHQAFAAAPATESSAHGVAPLSADTWLSGAALGSAAQSGAAPSDGVTRSDRAALPPGAHAAPAALQHGAVPSVPSGHAGEAPVASGQLGAAALAHAPPSTGPAPPQPDGAGGAHAGDVAAVQPAAAVPPAAPPGVTPTPPGPGATGQPAAGGGATMAASGLGAAALPAELGAAQPADVAAASAGASGAPPPQPSAALGGLPLLPPNAVPASAAEPPAALPPASESLEAAPDAEALYRAVVDLHDAGGEGSVDAAQLMALIPTGDGELDEDGKDDLLGLLKAAPSKKCPECSALNLSTQQECKQCMHRFQPKGGAHGVDAKSPLDSMMMGDLAPGTSSAAGEAADGVSCAISGAVSGAASHLVPPPAVPPSGSTATDSRQLTLPPGLIAGLGADASWDLGAGLGAGGLQYTIADADLLTRMVPKTPPRKKCVACNELNPTARQNCISCGHKFQMKPKRSAGSSALDSGGGDGEGKDASKAKREAAPAAEGAPSAAGGKLRAPRKRCTACQAYNPTAQQSCQACGARFTIKSKLKQQAAQLKQQQASQQPPSSQLPLSALPGALAGANMPLPAALASLGATPELRAQLGLRPGPAVTIGPDGRLHFHDTTGGGDLDLQGILNASAVLTSSGAPITSVANSASLPPAPAPSVAPAASAQLPAPSGATATASAAQPAPEQPSAGLLGSGGAASETGLGGSEPLAPISDRNSSAFSVVPPGGQSSNWSARADGRAAAQDAPLGLLAAEPGATPSLGAEEDAAHAALAGALAGAG